MVENSIPVDPEEESEKKLVHTMALAVVAVTIGGILILALRPWLQRFRERNEDTGAPAAGEVA